MAGTIPKEIRMVNIMAPTIETPAKPTTNIKRIEKKLETVFLLDI